MIKCVISADIVNDYLLRDRWSRWRARFFSKSFRYVFLFLIYHRCVYSCKLSCDSELLRSIYEAFRYTYNVTSPRATKEKVGFEQVNVWV